MADLNASMAGIIVAGQAISLALIRAGHFIPRVQWQPPDVMTG